jgi:hypothetical protein
MKSSHKPRKSVVVAACVALGAIGGIAGSAAAPSKTKSKSKTHSSRTAAGRAYGHRDFGGPGGPGGRAVHEEEVVLNKAGTAFITATEDHGTVKSVSGNDVTITEAANGVTYKDVTITIPDGATIIRDGATAKVSDLKEGDRIHVSQSSDGTFVFAADPSWRPAWGGGHDGPGHPGGPPPGP